MSKAIAYSNDKRGKVFIDLIVASLVSIIASLVLILFFALFIKWFNWGDSVITPANIVIKIISIAIGVLFVCRDGNKGVLKGASLGFVYIILCFSVFSILNGTMVLNMALVYDLFLGVISGAVLGAIIVNLKK